MKLIGAFIILILLNIVSSYTVSYDGFSVLRCKINDRKVYEEILKYSEENVIDVWNTNHQDGEIDLNLSPSQKKIFKEKYDKLNCKNFIEDLQKAIDEETRNNTAIKADTFFDSYHTYEEIMAWLVALANKYSFLYTVNLGNSTESRPILGIEMNGGSKKKRAELPTIYFQGGQHAREWIGPMTVCYIMYSLAEGYGKNPSITKIVDEINWSFVPLVNPDGYTYSRTNDRMWRKNRRNPPSGSSCYGVDTNRNWPAYWNRGGSSTNPCSETYMGISAASEVEVQTVINYWTNLSNIVVNSDYHSYGQDFMTPWGYTTTRPNQPDYGLQTAMGNKYVASVKLIDNKTYRVGTAGSYGIGSGGFDDYGYFNGVLYSQTVELRDTGTYGFLLPAAQIVPTGMENVNGVITQALAVLAENNIQRKK